MKKNRAFTLIELLVTIGIIGILSTVVVSGISGAKTADAGWFDSSPDTTSVNTMKKEAAITEMNQRKLLQTTPVPTFEQSQERENLVRRLNTFNKAEKVSYIYLLSYGKVMAFYTVKGKVSSLNSYLTTDVQLVKPNGDQCDYGSGSYCYTVPSPDLDGSYGDNGQGIFFFTTDNVYVEWNGEYLLADQALKLSTQPELIRVIK